MFDNQPTEQILRWISQGQVLQQQSELFRHQTLSPDTLLVAGFCALELQRALDFFHGFAPALQSSITHWVDGLLAADYRNNEFVETLSDRFHAVLIRGLRPKQEHPTVTRSAAIKRASGSPQFMSLGAVCHSVSTWNCGTAPICSGRP